VLIACQKTKNKQQTTKRRATIPPIPKKIGSPPLAVTNITQAIESSHNYFLQQFVTFINEALHKLKEICHSLLMQPEISSPTL